MTLPDDVAGHLAEVPHSVALGMRLDSFDGSRCRLSIPYAEHLVGDPDTGVIFGGAITALLDNAAGFVARPRDDAEPIGIATLDMRIDYMGPAEPGRDVFADAHCFHRTSRIAFVRAVAHQSTADDPIATCTATFMIGTPNAPRSETS